MECHYIFNFTEGRTTRLIDSWWWLSISTLLNPPTDMGQRYKQITWLLCERNGIHVETLFQSHAVVNIQLRASIWLPDPVLIEMQLITPGRIQWPYFAGEHWIWLIEPWLALRLGSLLCPPRILKCLSLHPTVIIPSSDPTTLLNMSSEPLSTSTPQTPSLQFGYDIKYVISNDIRFLNGVFRR